MRIGSRMSTGSTLTALLFALLSPGCQSYDGPADGGDGGDGASTCPAQDAAGQGLCDAIVGVAWDGRTCVTLTGCSCTGADCAEVAQSPEGCWRDRGRDCYGCALMDAAAARECGPDEDPALGWLWDGGDCQQLMYCECAGADCDRLYLEQALCDIAYGACLQD